MHISHRNRVILYSVFVIVIALILAPTSHITGKAVSQEVAELYAKDKYLVILKDEPLMEQRVKLDAELEALKSREKAAESNNILKQFFIKADNAIKRRIISGVRERHTERIDKAHERFKKRLKRQDAPAIIVKEYKYKINGFLLETSPEEAEKVNQVPDVEYIVDYEQAKEPEKESYEEYFQPSVDYNLSYCEDGTPIFGCSDEKPKHCNQDLTLTSYCLKCGCPENYTCVYSTEDPYGKCALTSEAKVCTYAGEMVMPEMCSAYKPWYCTEDAELVLNCQKCGCQSLIEECQVDGDCKPKEDINQTQFYCLEGTAYGFCSPTKPEYCLNGSIVSKCSKCGCPEGQVCQNDGTCKPVTETRLCADGTPYGYCSSVKPNYCNDEGLLIADCDECGCEQGFTCDVDRTCIPASVEGQCNCPEPGPWSECIDGRQYRTGHICGPSTNYECLSAMDSGLCNVCPTSEWSECINGKKTRTSYDYGAHTNYDCISFTETVSCANPDSGMLCTTDSDCHPVGYECRDGLCVHKIEDKEDRDEAHLYDYFDVCDNYMGKSSDPGQTNCDSYPDCCNWYQKYHIHDLGKLITENANSMKVVYAPGWNPCCEGHGAVYVSANINVNGPWTYVGKTVTGHQPQHVRAYINDVEKDFRYVKVDAVGDGGDCPTAAGHCYNDYSAVWVKIEGDEPEPTMNCSDRTLAGACSSTKPKICDNGILRDKCDICGCPWYAPKCKADGTCGLIAETCSDGTPLYECSAIRPEYCINGTLIDKCQTCGCPDGYECYTDGTCIPHEEYTCSDGTEYYDCSDTVPYYCTGSGELVNDCSKCGCPGGQYCDTYAGTCYTLKNLTCSDGTPYNYCSATKPNYCTTNGILKEECNICGCPSGQECGLDGTCTQEMIPTECSDGTSYGECSSTKPKYCENGDLINKCSVCGCDFSYECQLDGTCVEESQPSSGEGWREDFNSLGAWKVGTSGGGIAEVVGGELHIKTSGAQHAKIQSTTQMSTIDKTQPYTIKTKFKITKTSHWLALVNNKHVSLVYDRAGYDLVCRYGTTNANVAMITIGQWYEIELHVKPSKNNYDVYVNGALKKICQLSNEFPTYEFRIGDFETGSANYGEMYMDYFEVISGETETTTPSTDCSDGTKSGVCSLDKPKYCDNGKLIENCTICGCQIPYDQDCLGTGICVAKNESGGDSFVNTCTDSDGADDNIYIKGYIEGSRYDSISESVHDFKLYDACSGSGHQVSERYCYALEPGHPDGMGLSGGTFVYTCEYGCDNGACKQAGQTTCTDGTEEGLCSTTNVGKKCISGNLEWDCITCDCAPGYTCQTADSVCLASTEYTCTDYDGGNNIYVKSYAEGVSPDGPFKYNDYCSGSGNQVNEALCHDSAGGYRTPGITAMNCDIYGCVDGACLREPSATFGTCRETDSINDRYHKGSVTGYDPKLKIIYNETDTCTSSDYVDEFYCYYVSPEGGKAHTHEVHYCENGCENGACIH